MNKDNYSTANAGFLPELFLTDEDVSKCSGSLSKLMRHFDELVIITGSIATGWHLLESGRLIKKSRSYAVEEHCVKKAE